VLHGSGWLTPRPGSFTPGKDTGPSVSEAVWASGPVWKGAENLATHRDSIPGPSSPSRVAIRTELSRPTGKTGYEWITTGVWSRRLAQLWLAMDCWIRVSECSQVPHWYETQWQDREIAQSGCRTSWEQWQTSTEWWLAGANKFSESNSFHFCRPTFIPRTSTAALVVQHFNSRVLEEATSCHIHGAANFS
jgi:hypothetical protein